MSHKPDLDPASLRARQRLLGRARRRSDERAVIQRRDAGTPVPLSFDQERLWLVNQVHPGTSAHNIPIALRLRGRLHIDILREAFQALFERHESLRTAFVVESGRAVPLIVPRLPVELIVHDLSAASDEEVLLKALLDDEANRPFDLAAAPLLRAGVVHLGEGDQVLYITVHHLVADGWSLAVLMRDLAAYYNAKLLGGEPDLPELSLQFADYVLWQRARHEGSALDGQLRFWREALDGTNPGACLPTDRSQTDNSTVEGGTVPLQISPALHSAVKGYCQERKLSSFVVLVAAFKVLLARWSGESHVWIGTPVAGRTRVETVPLIGFFANTLVLHAQVDSQMRGEAFVDRIQRDVRAAFDHQELPLSRLIELLQPQRRGQTAPLFQAMFSLLPQAQSIVLDGLEIERLDQELKATDFDLFFALEEGDEGLRGGIAFNRALFERDTVCWLADAYIDVLSQLMDRPQARLAELRFDDRLESQARQARDRDQRETLTIAATFTAEPVAEPLRLCMEALGVRAEIDIAAYNQVFQELLSPASLFARNAGGANIILLRLSDWLPQEAQGESRACGEAAGAKLERTVNDFIAVLEGAVGAPRAPSFVILCPESPTLLQETEQSHLFERLESELIARCSGIDGVYPSRAADILSLYPIVEYYDAVADQQGHIPFTSTFYAALALFVARRWHALKRPPYKVIVLDCDNTLWSGVCGEVGARGVRLDPAREILQRRLRAQRDAGLLLCLCSKNEEDDVLRVFTEGTPMPLRLDDFVAWRIDWQAKSRNLRTLADQLGLGLDAFIFIDDNPVECAEVEANCPQVTVLCLPQEPQEIERFAHHVWAFDHLKVTAEDAKRSRFYQEEVQRKQLMRESLSFDAFLSGLGLEIEIGRLDEARLERASQLTLRTNQFNSTGRRRSVTQMRELLQSEEARILAVQVKDRFGDYGFVGLLVVIETSEAEQIESLLLSCRVLGRGVEHRMLAEVARQAADRKRAWVDIRFRRMQRNTPFAEFLDGLPISERVECDGESIYRCRVSDLSELRYVPAAHSPSGKEEARNVTAQTRAPALGRGGGALMTELLREFSDATKLSERVDAAPRRGQSSVKSKGVMPANALEERVLGVWREILSVEGIGVTDNFFDLGGHSVLLVRLASRLQEVLQREVPVISLFQYTTVRALAEHLETAAGTGFEVSLARGSRQRELLLRSRRQAMSRPQ